MVTNHDRQPVTPTEIDPDTGAPIWRYRTRTKVSYVVTEVIEQFITVAQHKEHVARGAAKQSGLISARQKVWGYPGLMVGDHTIELLNPQPEQGDA